jgi:2-polyprenyl-6-methoxyphenol hydroxylase-like FAD-dependent oxidoreductase
MWRGVVKGPKFLTDRSMVMIGEKNCKFVAYPIKEFSDGDMLINWICDLRYPKNYNWAKQDWNRNGNLEGIWPFFKNWRFDWLDVASLIENTKAIFEYPMVDRNPLPKWTFDRATLLGDSAHAMYPIGSNGASQAILDSVHLARSIEKYGLRKKALSHYEDIRRPIVNKIIEATRLDGPDKILDIVAKKAPTGFKNINDVMAPEILLQIAEKYKVIAGFDVDTLNASKVIMK